MTLKQKIVLTGGEGMIGRETQKLLRDLGYRVVTIDNMSRDPMRRPLSPYKDEHYLFDILDGGNYEAIVSAMSGAAAVINLAADVGGVGYNKANSPAIFGRNAGLQSIPVAAAQEAGVPTFIQISSACVYTPSEKPHFEYEPLRDPAPNNWGYTLAKRAGEEVALRAAFERCCILRPTNAFGKGDYYDDKAHVIPALIRRAAAPGPALVVKSPPDVVRSFAPASSVAQAIAAVLEKGEDGEIYNVSGFATRIGGLAGAILGRVDPDKRLIYQYDDVDTGEDVRLLSGEKLATIGGLGATISEFEAALDAAVEEYMSGALQRTSLRLSDGAVIYSGPVTYTGSVEFGA